MHLQECHTSVSLHHFVLGESLMHALVSTLYVIAECWKTRHSKIPSRKRSIFGVGFFLFLFWARRPWVFPWIEVMIRGLWDYPLGSGCESPGARQMLEWLGAYAFEKPSSGSQENDIICKGLWTALDGEWPGKSRIPPWSVCTEGCPDQPPWASLRASGDMRFYHAASPASIFILQR